MEPLSSLKNVSVFPDTASPKKEASPTIPRAEPRVEPRVELVRADAMRGLEGAAAGVQPGERSAIPLPHQLPPHLLPIYLYDVQALVKDGDKLKMLAETIKVDRTTPEIRRLTQELETAIATGKSAEISMRLETLKAHPVKAGIVMGRILKKHVQNRSNNDLLLEVAEKHFPHMNKLLVQLKDKSQKTLSVEGYEIILSLLQAKGKLDPSCEVCIGEKQFFLKFAGWIKIAEKRKAFIIRNQGETNRLDPNIHYCSVMVIKENLLEIYIFDSLGSQGYGASYPFALSEILRRECPSQPAHIYNATHVRQKTTIGCPIFALRDLVHFQSYAKAKEFINSHSIPSKDGAGDGLRNHYDMVALPPPMMKYTQDIVEIEEYEKKFPHHGPSLVQQLKEKEHVRPIPGKTGDFNRLVSDRYQKYKNFLIAVAIAHGQLIREKDK